MDITVIMRIAGIGFLVSISYILLNRAGRDEMAMLVSVAGAIIVLIMIRSQLGDLLDTVKGTFGL
jgi:stage III sporulation protein AC